MLKKVNNKKKRIAFKLEIEVICGSHAESNRIEQNLVMLSKNIKEMIEPRHKNNQVSVRILQGEVG